MITMDKMAAILADDIFKWIFLNENSRIPIQISLKFVPKSPIDNKSALVQVMAWCWTGDKPLPEPMMTQFNDAYMWHQGEMSKDIQINNVILSSLLVLPIDWFLAFCTTFPITSRIPPQQVGGYIWNKCRSSRNAPVQPKIPQSLS